MSCFGQDPYFNCPNRSNPPYQSEQNLPDAAFGRDKKMGSCSSTTARTDARSQQPGGARGHWQHQRAVKVLTSVPVTPGKGRGPRQEPGGQAAATKPGRGGPVKAAVTRPGSSVPPAAPGRGDAGSLALCGRGELCWAGSAVSQYRERGAARSGAAGPAGEPGWRAAGRCPA